MFILIVVFIIIISNHLTTLPLPPTPLCPLLSQSSSSSALDCVCLCVYDCANSSPAHV